MSHFFTSITAAAAASATRVQEKIDFLTSLSDGAATRAPRRRAPRRRARRRRRAWSEVPS